MLIRALCAPARGHAEGYLVQSLPANQAITFPPIFRGDAKFLRSRSNKQTEIAQGATEWQQLCRLFLPQMLRATGLRAFSFLCMIKTKYSILDSQIKEQNERELVSHSEFSSDSMINQRQRISLPLPTCWIDS